MSEVAPSGTSGIVKFVAAIAAVIVGLFLVFGAASAPVADAIFIGSIAVVLAVYIWSGVTPRQAKIVSIVLLFVAGYAFVRGFGLLDLTFLRQLGGIAAIVSGVILGLPFVKSKMGKS
jgi:hypothetical protein